MSRFYCENFSVGAKVTLESEESHHLARVLRLNPGDEIVLIDGKGAVANAVIVSANPKHCEVNVRDVTQELARSNLVLGFGIPKGPAQDFIFRRVTEIGLLAFQPLGTEHSLKAKEFNEERWQRVIPEIAKQCQEPVFPRVDSALTLEKALEKYVSSPIFFCDEAKRDPHAEASPASAPTLVLVGPEGGWSDRDRSAMLAAGARPFGLGRNRLRAETACLVAVTLMKERMGELKLA